MNIVKLIAVMLSFHNVTIVDVLLIISCGYNNFVHQYNGYESAVQLN